MSDEPANGDDTQSCRRCVRWRVVILAVLVGVLLSFGLSVILPERFDDQPQVRDSLAGIEYDPAGRRSGVTGVRISPVGEFVATGSINVDTNGVAIHGYDVVAYFTEGQPMQGREEYEVTYQEATFRFATPEHKQLFLDDPEAYIPAYGGYCALGVANGYKDGMHPEAFEIVDGRLFFNLTPWIHRSWQQHMDALIERGNRHWPEIKDSRRIGPGFGQTAHPVE